MVINIIKNINNKNLLLFLFILGFYNKTKANNIYNNRNLVVEFNALQLAIMGITSSFVGREFRKRGIPNGGKFLPFHFDFYFKNNSARELNIAFIYRYDNNAVYKGMHEFILMYGEKFYWNSKASREIFFEYKGGISIAKGPYHQHNIIEINETPKFSNLYNNLNENDDKKKHTTIPAHKEDYFCISLACESDIGYRWFVNKNFNLSLALGILAILPIHTKSPLEYSFIGILVHRIHPIFKFGLGIIF